VFRSVEKEKGSMLRVLAQTVGSQRALAMLLLVGAPAVGAGEPALRLYDAHIHYSHDAWDQLPPRQAIAVLRDAGLQRAFVSSSSDEGTQKLFAIAPDLIVPVLRPYRRRGETSTWFKDDTVPAMLAGLVVVE
jgi:hypothetical protein